MESWKLNWSNMQLNMNTGLPRETKPSTILKLLLLNSWQYSWNLWKKLWDFRKVTISRFDLFYIIISGLYISNRHTQRKEKRFLTYHQWGRDFYEKYWKKSYQKIRTHEIIDWWLLWFQCLLVANFAPPDVNALILASVNEFICT